MDTHAQPGKRRSDLKEATKTAQIGALRSPPGGIQFDYYASLSGGSCLRCIAMAEKKPVKFKTHGGEPLLVEVVGTNGKTYDVRINLSIFGVFDTGEMQPSSPPGVGEVPKFEMQIQVVTTTLLKS